MSHKKTTLIISLCLASTALYAEGFKLTSPTIKSGAMLTDEQVFNGFGCTGKNHSPALKWTSEPKGTKSYAVTLYDPDAPTGSGWWHWVVYNIPAGTAELVAGAGEASGKLLPPSAVQGRTDYGNHEFGGACPPAGAKPHRYIFTVHALKVENWTYQQMPAPRSLALWLTPIHWVKPVLPQNMAVNPSIKTNDMWKQQTLLLTARKRGFHLITDEILSALPILKTVECGLLHLFIQHTSASLSINENADPTVRDDLERHFNVFVPEKAPYYQHDYEGDDDMPAHIKSSLLGCSVSIPITEGALNLGVWQGIYLCEHRNQGGRRSVVATIQGQAREDTN